MLIQKGSREDAIHALINLWLKDKTPHCGWCGEIYDHNTYPCCEKPYISDNAGILKQFSKELQETRDESRNKFASNKDNTMRLALSFPPSMLLYLEKSFDKLYNEPLFTKEYNVVWFMKKFGKYFAVPKEI